MMPFPEKRNEAAMLRAFHKQYPSYNLTPMLYKRQQQLIDARAFLSFGRTVSHS